MCARCPGEFAGIVVRVIAGYIAGNELRDATVVVERPIVIGQRCCTFLVREVGMSKTLPDTFIGCLS